MASFIRSCARFFNIGFNCYCVSPNISTLCTTTGLGCCSSDCGRWVVLTSRGWSINDSLKFCERWRNIPPTFNWDDSRFVFCFFFYTTMSRMTVRLKMRVKVSLAVFPSEALWCTENTKQLNPKSWSKLPAHWPQTHWAKAAAGPPEGILRSLRTLLRSALVPGQDG